jgi:hypothetical protein
MLVRSTTSTTSMPTVLARNLCKSKLRHAPRVGSYSTLSFILMNACQYIPKDRLAPNARTSIEPFRCENSERNQRHKIGECLIQNLLYILSPRSTNHVPIASNDTKIFRSHIAILNVKGREKSQMSSVPQSLTHGER